MRNSTYGPPVLPPDPARRAVRRRLFVCLSLLLALSVPLSGFEAAVAGESNCVRDEGWAEMRADLATQVLALTNTHRASLGLSTLVTSPTLTAAAEWKAAHMAFYDYFEHDDVGPPVDRTWDQRLEDCGYPHGAGENIAYGYKTASAVFAAWLASPGHRQNIERATYKVIGLGVASDSDGTLYWAQEFGTTIEAPVELPPLDPEPEPDPSDPGPSDPDPSDPDPSDPDLEEPAANGAPQAADDRARVRPRRAVVIAPLLNDSDPDGDTLSLGTVGSVRYGKITIDEAAGKITYRARRGTARRTEIFNYQVVDPHGAVDEGSITIRIRRRAAATSF